MDGCLEMGHPTSQTTVGLARTQALWNFGDGETPGGQEAHGWEAATDAAGGGGGGGRRVRRPG